MRNLCTLIAKRMSFASKVMKNFVLYCKNVCVLNVNLSKIYAFGLQLRCAFWEPKLRTLRDFKLCE